MIGPDSDDEDDGYSRIADVLPGPSSKPNTGTTGNVSNPQLKPPPVPANHPGSSATYMEVKEVPTKGSNWASVAHSVKQVLRRDSSGGIYDSSVEVTRHEKYSMYVLLARCIAIPFNSEKQQSLSDKMQTTLTMRTFDHIKSRVINFLRGDLNMIRAADRYLVAAIESFFDGFLRLHCVHKLVRRGGLTLSELKDVFAIMVNEEVSNMGFREASTAEQLKSKWMSLFTLIIEGDQSHKSDSTGLNLNKEKLMIELRQVLRIRTQIHNRIAKLMNLNKPQKLISAVRVELEERLQCQHDPEIFNMPVNWFDEEMHHEVERALAKQTEELKRNLMSFASGSNPNTNAEDDGDVRRYLAKMNYKIRKSKSWINTRTGSFGSPDQDFSMQIVIPNFTITLRVEYVKDLALQFTRSKCLMIAKLHSVSGKDQSKRINLETTAEPSMFEGLNEEATFYFGGPLPQLQLSFCNHRKEGPIGKSMTSLHIVGSTQFQLYPDRVEANPEWPEHKTVFQLGTRREVKMVPVKKKTLPPFVVAVNIQFSVPENVKCTGELFLSSKVMTNGEWKKRYVILLEASRANFILSCYKPGSDTPVDILPLDGFVVDYLNLEEESLTDVVEFPKIKDLPAGVTEDKLFYFVAKRDRIRVELATSVSAARDLWLDKLHVATRQTFKPEPPMELENVMLETGEINLDEIEKYSKLSFISPSDDVDPHYLFKLLLEVMLDYKINDPYRSMGWFTASQQLMIDEYCARYAIRCTERYLNYLKVLLRRAFEGCVIDPSLLHLAFVCSSASFKGIRLPSMGPCKVNELLGLFTKDEFECFYYEDLIQVEQILEGDLALPPSSEVGQAIEENLMETIVVYLLSKIENFSVEFPAGKPAGVLESFIAFLERVMNETNPYPSETIKKDPYAHIVANKVTTRSLALEMEETANNLKNSSGGANALRGVGGYHVTKKSEDRGGMMSHVVLLMVERCITRAAAKDFSNLCSFNFQELNPRDLRLSMQFNLEDNLEKFKRLISKITRHLWSIELFYAESFKSFPAQLKLYLETVLALMFIRFNSFMEMVPIDSWQVFSLYQQMNAFFVSSRLLSKGRFHKQLCDFFAPLVIRYMDTTERSIATSYNKNIAQEKWVSRGASCQSSEDVFWKVRALKNFVDDLRWPHEEFSQHLTFRMLLLAANVIEAVISDATKAFHSAVSLIPKSRAAVLTPELCVAINVLTRSDDLITSLRLQKFVATNAKTYGEKSQFKQLTVSPALMDHLDAVQISLHKIFEAALQEQLNELAKFDNRTTFIYTLYSFGVNLKTRVKNSVTRAAPEATTQEQTSLMETAPVWLVKWLTTSSGAQSDEFDLSTPYIDFLRNNLAVMRENIKMDEFVLEILKDWYDSIVSTLLKWTNERLQVQLDIVQLNTVNSLLKKAYKSFLMENLKVTELETDDLKVLRSRLEAEEKGANRLGKGNLVTEGVADSDEEDEI